MTVLGFKDGAEEERGGGGGRGGPDSGFLGHRGNLGDFKSFGAKTAITIHKKRHRNRRRVRLMETQSRNR